MTAHKHVQPQEKLSQQEMLSPLLVRLGGGLKKGNELSRRGLKPFRKHVDVSVIWRMHTAVGHCF